MNSTRMKNLQKKIHRLANKKRKPSGNSINQKKNEEKKILQNTFKNRNYYFFVSCYTRNIYTKYNISLHGKWFITKEKLKFKSCAHPPRLLQTTKKNVFKIDFWMICFYQLPQQAIIYEVHQF